MTIYYGYIWLYICIIYYIRATSIILPNIFLFGLLLSKTDLLQHSLYFLKIKFTSATFIYKILRVLYAGSGQIVPGQYYRTRNQQQGNFTRPKVNKSCSFLFLGPNVFKLLPTNIKMQTKLIYFQKS